MCQYIILNNKKETVFVRYKSSEAENQYLKVVEDKLLQDKNILDYSDDAYLELINNNIESNNTKKVYKLLMEYKKKYQNYL